MIVSINSSMFRFITSSIILIGSIPTMAAAPPDTIHWSILEKLEFVPSQHKEYGEVYLPKFSKNITKLANKEVVIRGYLVPVDKTTWALSKTTYASCFFCGKAGPETVMGLEFKDDPGKLKMDANVYIKGKFIINGKNVDDWMYSIKGAQIIR